MNLNRQSVTKNCQKCRFWKNNLYTHNLNQAPQPRRPIWKTSNHHRPFSKTETQSFLSSSLRTGWCSNFTSPGHRESVTVKLFCRPQIWQYYPFLERKIYTHNLNQLHNYEVLSGNIQTITTLFQNRNAIIFSSLRPEDWMMLKVYHWHWQC